MARFSEAPLKKSAFLTAKHVGIALSDTVTVSSGPDAGVYSILGWFDDPGSDLRIIEIAGTLTGWALLYFPSNEIGQQAVMFGRGGPGTGTVTANSELKGWTTPPASGPISWGRNIVSGISGLDQIRASFDENGLSREAAASIGDSGGGWFLIDNNDEPRLAGITFGTSGPFQFDVAGSPGGNPFGAALFDRGGLWEGPVGSEIFTADNPQNFPGSAFATRISNRINWIKSIIPLPEPDTDDDGIPDGQDNCPYVPNIDQLDSGSVGFGSPADGIGNACQCGDVSGDGVITSADAFFVKRFGLGLDPFVFNQPDNCDVTGDGRCTGSDGSVINAIAADLPAALFGQNCVNATP